MTNFAQALEALAMSQHNTLEGSKSADHRFHTCLHSPSQFSESVSRKSRKLAVSVSTGEPAKGSWWSSACEHCFHQQSESHTWFTAATYLYFKFKELTKFSAHYRRRSLPAQLRNAAPFQEWPACWVPHRPCRSKPSRPAFPTVQFCTPPPAPGQQVSERFQTSFRRLPKVAWSFITVSEQCHTSSTQFQTVSEMYWACCGQFHVGFSKFQKWVWIVSAGFR